MVRDRLFGDETLAALPRVGAIRIPGSHVEADELIVEGIARLAIHRNPPLSIVDLGAGVGQLGAVLRSRFPEDARWQGWDGAGDVEEYTRGLVSFVDLTMPLALPRADWVWIKSHALAKRPN